MFVSLCRVTAGAGLEWPAFVRLAGQAGYDGVDVDVDALRRDGAKSTLALLREHHLKPAVCGLYVEFRKDDATFREGMKLLDDDARLAAELGCPRVATWVPPAFEAPADQMRSVLRRRFTEIARVLAGHGVRLGLEFISPWHFRQQGNACVWQMADMLELCAECGTNVGLLLDCWHWHHDPDHSVEAIVRAGRERIVYVHLNDSAPLLQEEIRDNQRLLPGEGVIDLKGFLRALKQIGYVDGATVEVFGRLKDVPADVAAREALAATRQVLASM